MTETEIQSQIIKYLNTRDDLFFQRTNNIPVSQMRGGKRIFRSLPPGQKKGFPDIVVIKNGIFIGLEVKKPKCYQSKDQKILQKQIEAAGGKYYVVRSLEDVKKGLEEIN